MCISIHMSLPMRKPTMWFPTRSDENLAVQQQMARGYKFWIKKVELYYPCSENNGADHFAVTAKLVCAFVFAYVDCWFSDVMAHITDNYNINGAAT